MPELYWITPNEPHTPTLRAFVQAAITGGCRYIQYRNKHPHIDINHRQRQAEAIATDIAQHHLDVHLIINDHPLIAQQCAAGVHLGQQDMSIQEARTYVGPHAIIGATCGNDAAYGLAQQAAGCDYCAFGAYRPSHTKTDTVPLVPNTLHTAHTLGIQRIAVIGGIMDSDVPDLCQYPITFLCVSDAIGHDPQTIEQHTRYFQQRIQQAAYKQDI